MKVSRFVPGILMFVVGVLILTVFVSCKAVETKPEKPKLWDVNV